MRPVLHLRRRSAASWISSSSLLDIARLITAMFFLTFDIGFRLEGDEDGDMETRIISISGISATFIHRKGRLHCHRHRAEEKATSPVPIPTSPCLRPNLSLVICTVPHSLILRGTFSVCATHEGQRERSLNSHVFNFVVFRDFFCRCLKICDQVLLDTKTTAFSTGQRRGPRCRN